MSVNEGAPSVSERSPSVGDTSSDVDDKGNGGPTRTMASFNVRAPGGESTAGSSLRPSKTPMQRNRQRIKEKQRRKDILETLEELRKHVPLSPEDRVTRTMLLRRTIEYIQFLENRASALETQLHEVTQSMFAGAPAMPMAGLAGMSSSMPSMQTMVKMAAAQQQQQQQQKHLVQQMGVPLPVPTSGIPFSSVTNPSLAPGSTSWPTLMFPGAPHPTPSPPTLSSSSASIMLSSEDIRSTHPTPRSSAPPHSGAQAPAAANKRAASSDFTANTPISKRRKPLEP